MSSGLDVPDGLERVKLQLQVLICGLTRLRLRNDGHELELHLPHSGRNFLDGRELSRVGVEVGIVRDGRISRVRLDVSEHRGIRDFLIHRRLRRRGHQDALGRQALGHFLARRNQRPIRAHISLALARVPGVSDGTESSARIFGNGRSFPSSSKAVVVKIVWRSTPAAKDTGATKGHLPVLHVGQLDDLWTDGHRSGREDSQRQHRSGGGRAQLLLQRYRWLGRFARTESTGRADKQAQKGYPKDWIRP
eukprot:scaffold395_cov243-Pinguiococcus_pyrenoidosus.AAC.16